MTLPAGFILDPIGSASSAPAIPPSDSEVKDYITQAAIKRGIPPEDALKTWEGEGKGAWQSNFVKNGKREPSYGPYQLYKGGGLGNEFQNKTGLDPADPANWRQGVDFALDTAKKEGWRQWYGAPPELRSRGGYAEPMRLGPSGAELPDGFQLDGAAPAAPTAQPQTDQPQSAPPPHTPWGEIGDDAARSYISGAIDAGVGLAGLPGDALKLGRWAGEQIGLGDPSNNLPINGSEEVGNYLRSKIGDWSYDPKTGAGEIANKIANYGISGAGAGARTALRGAGQVLATAGGAQLGSDIGGPIGEAAGALVGAHGASAPTIMGKAPKVTEADRILAAHDDVMTPATAAVRRVSQDAYKKAENAGLAVNGNNFANLLRHFRSTPEYEGIKIPGASLQMAPKNLSLQEFDDLRQKVLKISMKDADPKKRMRAGDILEKMDRFINNPTNTISGNAPEALAALDEARRNWKIYRKSADLDSILEVARDRAGQYSVSGNENAIRTGFRQLAMKIDRDKRIRNLYTADERAFIRQLARGGHVRDFLRGVGAVLNSRTAQSAGGLAFGGWQAYSYQTQGQLDPWSAMIGATLWAGGKGARGLSGTLAKNKAKTLSRLVRSGGQMTSQPGLPGFGEFRPLPMAGALIGLKNSVGQ